jgi:hypothetical protein
VKNATLTWYCAQVKMGNFGAVKTLKAMSQQAVNIVLMKQKYSGQPW